MSATTRTRYSTPSVPEKADARERELRVARGEVLRGDAPDQVFSDGERTVMRYGRRLVILTSKDVQRGELPDIEAARRAFAKLRGA